MLHKFFLVYDEFHIMQENVNRFCLYNKNMNIIFNKV